jgi:Fe-S cluster assembly iron-binding protein IscA
MKIPNYKSQMKEKFQITNPKLQTKKGKEK